ncbi:SAM-dependent methyltransferase [Nocardioides daedukensis]|uniref:SAM-dependent methyltransferase n=1 Tax=Nocardioides daedukensis TaxID=634462 RepID=A0A7Y9S1L3_9ACTN|nr:class I SAM-dependent methyltransferase [Nocardioides daedukensis]NYG59314.1 SAM-dependent methyltransferase [Nocardioides daedukensis]
MSRAEVAAAYDSRAEEYVEKLGSVHQMADRDRATIVQWRDSTGGRLLDAGCGPGHWTEVLSERGRRDVVGIDGSTRFLESARDRFPGNRFLAADLSAFPVTSRSLGGILAWYSVIHASPAELPEILDEFGRALAPGGSLLVGFFAGEAGVAFEHAVTTAYYWSAEALTDLLHSRGFTVEHEETRRDPDAHRTHGELRATLGAVGIAETGRARDGDRPSLQG